MSADPLRRGSRSWASSINESQAVSHATVEALALIEEFCKILVRDDLSKRHEGKGFLPVLGDLLVLRPKASE